MKSANYANDFEKAKTREIRAEDIAYTINHALACTATDFIDPYVGNWTQKHLGKRVSVGCGHDHRQDHAPGERCLHEGSHLGHWWLGEIAGDFGAVPVTVAVQRLAPGMMDNIRNMLEPVLGPLFRVGAHRAAKHWQRRHSDKDSQHKEAQIYESEVRHLPQALLWTVSSVVINLATQRALGNRAPIWQLAAGKAAGASISAGLVVSGRGLWPDKAETWDGFTSQKLFIPATKTIGNWAGIDEESVDRMAEKEGEDIPARWAKRIRQNGVQTQMI